MGVNPQFVHFGDVRSFELADGVTGRPLFGEGAMLNLIEFAPGSEVPLHSHPHEQLGIVLRGMQALVVDGKAHELGPHEGYVLPGGEMDTCIVLRTALVKDGRMAVQAGAGIVYDSDPASEQQECINKAKALFRAAEEAHRFASRAERGQ